MKLLRGFKIAATRAKIRSIFRHLPVLTKEATSLRKTARLGRFASLVRTTRRTTFCVKSQ